MIQSYLNHVGFSSSFFISAALIIALTGLTMVISQESTKFSSKHDERNGLRAIPSNLLCRHFVTITSYILIFLALSRSLSSFLNSSTNGIIFRDTSRSIPFTCPTIVYSFDQFDDRSINSFNL